LEEQFFRIILIRDLKMRLSTKYLKTSKHKQTMRNRSQHHKVLRGQI
jgi:hypothetical protein